MSEHPESQVRADNEVFLRRRIEELEAEVERLRAQLESERNHREYQVAELQAKVERLREALNALVIVNGREIGYRTMNNIPMAMAKRIEKKVRAALPGEGEE